MSGRDADQDREPPGQADDYAELAAGVRRLAEFSPDDPGRRELLPELVTACLPLAHHVASRYRGRGHSQRDLRRVAVAGLTSAISRYRPDRDGDFLAFAVPIVMGEVRRHLRDAGWGSRVRQRPMEPYRRLASATSELAERLNRAPTPRELAEHLQVGVEDVYETLATASSYETSPLSGPDRPDDAATPAADPGAVDDSAATERLLDVLPDGDRQIVLLRFRGGLSQSQIARRMGLSQLQVSDRLSRALTRLRTTAAEPASVARAATGRRLRARSTSSAKVVPVEHPAGQHSADGPVGGNADQTSTSCGQSTQVQEATVAETGSQPTQSDRIDEVPATLPPAPATMKLTAGGFSVAAEAVEPAFTVLHVSGEVDMVTAPELTEHVQRHFGADGADRTLVFDLTGVTFLASAGLAVLAEAANLAEERGATIRVVAPSHSVTRPLEVTGLDRMLPTYADLTSAIRER